ncbi:hypothetical protein Zmor_005160 [Zophobas morio]|uniref:BtpA domain containing protein n=1 Tax=Zophobas morio TaxID=2755281 RepID=A0AA38IU24_9CUCU|nr:hypothetical protein Zmor_005160 [Zophobas morio]
MLKFRTLFGGRKCAVIGMVHVGALPGTPRFENSVEKLVHNALKEVEIYLKCDIDGLLVENMHDVPYIQSRHFNPEVTATMTRVCSEIKKIVDTKLPCGLQVLASGNKEALAVAQATGFHFIRAEGFVFGHVADEGYTDANAGLTLRYRKNIQADDVLVFADIKKKHSSHAVTSDVSLVETAKAAEFFLADGLILTGTATGSPADGQELKEVQACTSLPVLIGSGITVDNVSNYSSADAFIIGSHFKKGGKWGNELDVERVKRFIEKKNSLCI